jgi:hypothetical protein
VWELTEVEPLGEKARLLYPVPYTPRRGAQSGIDCHTRLSPCQVPIHGIHHKMSLTAAILFDNGMSYPRLYHQTIFGFQLAHNLRSPSDSERFPRIAALLSRCLSSSRSQPRSCVHSGRSLDFRSRTALNRSLQHPLSQIQYHLPHQRLAIFEPIFTSAETGLQL